MLTAEDTNTRLANEGGGGSSAKWGRSITVAVLNIRIQEGETAAKYEKRRINSINFGSAFLAALNLFVASDSLTLQVCTMYAENE